MSATQPSVGDYPLLPGRGVVWREIARYVARDAPAVGTLVELGAGYCDFSNAFSARRRIAYELNPAMAPHAAPGVELRVADAVTLDGLGDASADLVFASNFLEHLGAEALDALFERLRRTVAPGGRLILLQPNHRRCAAHYFDDPTHCTIFDDRMIGPWLAERGFSTRRVIPGLLPFSMKSRLPKWGPLVWLYLRSPWRPLAAQMYVVAERAR